MERFANWVRTEVGVPDVVVNNAGIAVVGPLLAHTEEDWQRIVGVNLLGVARGCRLFGAQMAERGTGGHLVNIASAAAFAPSASLPAYATTKAAVRMLSECLRAELAGAGHRGDARSAPGSPARPSPGPPATSAFPPARKTRCARTVARALRRRRFPPEKVALAVMRAVLRDQPVVPVNAEARITLRAVQARSRHAARAGRGRGEAVAVAARPG